MIPNVLLAIHLITSPSNIPSKIFLHQSYQSLKLLKLKTNNKTGMFLAFDILFEIQKQLYYVQIILFLILNHLIQSHAFKFLFFGYSSLTKEFQIPPCSTRNFAKFTGKHLCQSIFFNKVAGQSLFFNKVEDFNFIKKEALAHVFSCEFCETFKNFYFTEHLRWLLLALRSFSEYSHFSGASEPRFCSEFAFMKKTVQWPDLHFHAFIRKIWFAQRFNV